MTEVYFATTFYTERTDEEAPLVARHVDLSMVPIVGNLTEKDATEDVLGDLIDRVILEALAEKVLLTNHVYHLSAKAKITYRHTEWDGDWDVEFTFENVSCFLCGTISETGEITYLPQPKRNEPSSVTISTKK
ncbi:hypothetical protein [Vibrio phage vB_VmeM-Yong XC32]|nr:hypothetical protein [Vibrio phage vB_VmeM-Yong XC31]QAX96496.1 hypothetical protein [Vibrio phage vB_VmeM-Yong XC32]QAX96813.1 hypothetical protein [Vibrio phage vB_VmeM-Yong MS31]QAX97132.1 hypothetical protein [Vibrio phage vB_VmeM-Yong MS32]